MGSMAAPSDSRDARLYDLYDELDRVEELIEDMIALGIRSMDDAEARLTQLEADIDALEAGGSAP
jgi:hypothetical protein